MKMKANPKNPAYSCVVNPEYKRLFNNKPDYTYFGYKTPTPSGGHGGGGGGGYCNTRYFHLNGHTGRKVK